MIFTRVFSNFLIFLKFSQETFYRDNIALHLFKYVSCIMFMCIYVFDKVLNCFWNLYSSLCSFCGGIEKCLFVDRCVTSGASLFQVFRQWRVAQNRAEGKKAKERNWERGGFLSFLALSPTLFFLLLFFAPSPLTGLLEQALLLLAYSAQAVKKQPLTQTFLGVRHAFLPHPLTTSCVGCYKNERQQNYVYLRLGVFFRIEGKLICYCTTCTFLASG